MGHKDTLGETTAQITSKYIYKTTQCIVHQMQTQLNTPSSTRQEDFQRIQYTQKMRYNPTMANHREKRKGDSMENSTDPGTIDLGLP